MSATPPEAFRGIFVDGSEIGSLLRSRDWSATSLGSVETWSPILKTALSLLFNNGCPMLLVWGDDRCLFYNEAYASGSGESLPALGQPLRNDQTVGRTIGSQVEQVFATGQSVQHLSSSLADRDSGSEMSGTWTYSPLWDEAGRVAGVFVVVSRGPDRQQFEQALIESETLARTRAEELSALMEIAPAAIWIARDPKCHRVTANQTAYELMRAEPGSAATATPQNSNSVLPFKQCRGGQEIPSQDLPLQKAVRTGQAVTDEIEFVFADGTVQFIYGRAVPLHNAAGEIRGAIAAFVDITDRRQDETEREQLLQDLATERAHFEAVLRQMPAGIIVAEAPSGRLILGNQQVEQIWRRQFYYSQEVDEYREYQGFHPDGRLYAPEEWPLARSLRTGEVVTQEEIRFLRGDETDGFMEVSSTPIYDAQGRIVSGVVIFQDITNRKLAEIALREKSAELQHVTETAGVGLTRCSRDLRYLSANPAYAQLVGLPPEAIVGKPIEEVMGESAFGVIRPYIERVLRGERVEYEAEVPFAVGGARYLYVVYQPDHQPDGVIVGWIAAIVDITDRKRIEEALRTSEERLRFAVEGASLGTWEYDLVSSQIVWSEQAKRMFGVPLDAEVDYEMFIQTLHPDDRDRIHEAVERAIAEQNTYDIEMRSVWSDGSVHWIRSVGRARYNREGVAMRMVGVAFDITDRKQAEAELRESERRFRRLVESNMFGVGFGDFTGGIQYANDYFLNMVGYSRTEFEAGQLRWTEITPPEYLYLDEQAIAELRTRGVAVPFEKEYIRKDGSRVPILIGSALLQEPYDRQQEIIAFYIDLTGQKQAEAEREKLLQQTQAAREEAETANRIKDEFLAVLSHELRSPLNPILGWSKLLQTRPFDPPELHRALQTIERNAKLQTQLIDDLLDVSRILQGKIAVNTYPVNLVAVIEAALETVQLAAEAKQIQIQTLFMAAPIRVLGDSARLQQIVWNLLSNAVKFTPDRGRVEVKLSLVSSHSSRINIEEPVTPDRGLIANYAQITVRDTGKGISPGFLPHVFDYFRQEDGKTTRKFGGLGLGLAIVRHFTELHGGTVQASSDGEGQGATFMVRLPLMPHNAESRDAVPAYRQLLDFRQLTILVVDDDEDVRDLVRVILEQQGAQVRTATSAIEALLLFDRQPPAVLISDIGMPEMDGYELIQHIRRRSPQQGGYVPAIALTAYAGEYNQQQALAAGFQQHLAKPIEPENLVSAIAGLINPDSAGS